MLEPRHSGGSPRHFGAARRVEPGTHEHDGVRHGSPVAACLEGTVFMGSGLVASRRPGMTVEPAELQALR